MALNIPGLKQVVGSLKIRLTYAFAFLIPLFVFSALTAITLEPGTLAHAGDVRYLYDEFGRIIGEIDSAGSSTDYTYDARGNILSIKNSSATTVTITGFTPTSGTAGNSVTIYGTAFSNTASQNTVSFNGIAATVTSATATSLVALVPTGASSGPITVTTPTGSATSTDHFIVNSLPVITGFTPTIGSVGTTVAITGSSFSDNKVVFNETLAALSSASATQIITHVPSGATSGPISVTTPAGKAVSTTDFFVPPGSYTAANVAFTGRIDVDGGSQTVAINTANNVGLLVFNGAAGQRVTLQMIDVTLAGSTVSILKPDGTILASTTIDINGGYLVDNTLPVSGGYTILVAPQGSATGKTKLSLLSVVDITGQIAINASPVTVTIAVPGQKARLIFNGTAGQQINVQTAGPTIPSQISILNPDGTVLTSASTATNGGSAYSQFQSLPVTGAYTVFLNPIGAAQGSISLMLGQITGLSGPIALNTPVTVAVPGQSVTLAVSAAAGQQVSAALTGTLATGALRLLDTSGAQIASVPIAADGTAFISRQSISLAGTYTASIDPAAGATGTATLVVSTPVSSPTNGMASAATTLPGQSAALTFDGAIGQNVTVALMGGSFTAGQLTLAYPVTTGAGATASTTLVVVASAPIAADGSASLAGVILPVAATYTIFVDPASGAIGSGTVSSMETAKLPIITALNPPSINDNPGPIALTVFGRKFAANSVVALNGVDLVTVYVNPNMLTATVPAQAAGSKTITVKNPDTTAPGGAFISIGATLPVDIAGQTINGTAGDDTLTGGPGNNTINGFAGNDILYGSDGNDTLNGGDGNDYLVGGNGNDVLNGGPGNDRLDGGWGNNTYVFDAAFGQDLIYEDNRIPGKVETALFTSYASTDVASVTRNWLDLIITFTNSTDQVTVGRYFYYAVLYGNTTINYFGPDLWKFADGVVWDYATIWSKVQ